MSEMVERVALVIKAAHRDAGPVGLARAIISAMREPTEAMLDAGWHEGGADISAMWRAMIDAAPDDPVPHEKTGDYYADPDVGPAIVAQD